MQLKFRISLSGVRPCLVVTTYILLVITNHTKTIRIKVQVLSESIIMVLTAEMEGIHVRLSFPL